MQVKKEKKEMEKRNRKKRRKKAEKNSLEKIVKLLKLLKACMNHPFGLYYVTKKRLECCYWCVLHSSLDVVFFKFEGFACGSHVI